jgi:hypothetical protein
LDDEVTCAFCHDGDYGDDVVAHFWDDRAQQQVMAHGQCGEDAGLRLA